MTHPHPQPERCIHECVCHLYLDYPSDDLDPCLAKKCEHDTRTHTPTAPATEPKPLRYSGVTVFTPPELSRHDAAIRKAEREQVLNEFVGKLIYFFEEEAEAEGMLPLFSEVDALSPKQVMQWIESLRGGA